MSLDSSADNDVRMDMGALGAALRRRWLRILIVTAVLLGGTYAVLHFVPNSYESTAAIQVGSRDSSYTRATGDTAASTAIPQDALDSLVSSQIELVKSRDTLLAVVRTQKLTAVPEFNGTATGAWASLMRILHRPSATETAEDIATDALADHLLVVRDRDSAFIDITVHSTDPVLAATLANAIAEADLSRRAGQSISDTADASQWLQTQITELRKRVSDAETKVANFKVDNDLYTGTNSTSLVDQQLTDISTQITAAQGRKSAAQSRSSLIRGLLAAGQPIDGVDDVRNSVTIQQLMQQKAQLTSQRAQLLATLLPTHPSVEAVTAQITAVDKQIIVEGRRVADALDAEAKIEDASITSLQTNLNSIKSKAGDATKQNVTLDALNREAKADRDLLESYMQRYRDATSRADGNAVLPDLRVITDASPSATPASPKTGLILAAVAFVSLAIQIAGILLGELLSGRALVEPVRRVHPRPALQYANLEQTPAAARLSQMATAAEEASAAYQAPEEELEEPAAEESYVAPPVRRGAGSALRAWFSRRARSVGPALASYEPPMSPEAPAAATDGRDPYAMDAPAAAAEAAYVAPEVIGAAPAEVDSGFEAANDEKIANLSADMILGRARVVMLAALDGAADLAMSDRLVADVLHRGLSVVRVDAGSGRTSTEPGITDLSTEIASFGDVVQKTAREGLAEVPWGHLPAIDRRSTRPLTLVEALSDIYEVVIVLTGRVGMASSLPLFAGVPCRLVLVAEGAIEEGKLESARADASALGYEPAEFLATPLQQAQVA